MLKKMPKVTFTVELDAEDYMEDSDGGVTISQWFENTVNENIHSRLTDIIEQYVRDQIIDAVTSRVPLLLEEVISERFGSILNEDRSYETKDGWSTNKFVGTLDDFIAASIERRMHAPVDSNGKYLFGGKGVDYARTWVEWTVERRVEDIAKAKLDALHKILDKKLTAYIDNECRDRSEKLLEKQIRMKLSALGIISEGGA